MGKTPKAHLLGYLVSSQWNHLGRIRRYDVVVGGVLLRVGFEVLEAHTTPSQPSALCCGPDVNSQLLL